MEFASERQLNFRRKSVDLNWTLPMALASVSAMNIEIHFREMDSSDGIKSHVEKQADKLKKFVTNTEHVRVIVGAKRKGHRHFAEAYWHSGKGKKDYFGKADGDNVYAQIDEVFAKLVHQLEKEHDKKVTKRHRKVPLKKTLAAPTRKKTAAK